MGIVIDLTAALWRRVAALELEVAERRQALSQEPRGSWQHEVHLAELIEAERRLSIAEGMPRDERPAVSRGTGPCSLRMWVTPKSVKL
jgi:hypothetical protein